MPDPGCISFRSRCGKPKGRGTRSIKSSPRRDLRHRCIFYFVQQCDNHIDLAIIGGGASGMAAAWHASSCSKERGTALSIAVFERNDRAGKKLLSTGNGRCNLTNLDCSLRRFHGGSPEFCRYALERFPPTRVLTLFESIGVRCIVEEGGKVFPSSLHASSVLDALRLALEENGIRLITGVKVSALEADAGGFRIVSGSSGRSWTASGTIVAAGGKCAPATGSDGGGYGLLRAFSHALIEPLPSIVQLTTETRLVKPLSGNKIRGAVTLVVDGRAIRTETGEILFTDYGLSGPPVLQLSGYVSRSLYEAKRGKVSGSAAVLVDFMPELDAKEVERMLHARKERFRSRSLEEFLTGLFHRRLAYGLLRFATGKPLSAPVAGLTDVEMGMLVRACKELPVNVTGTMPFSHAQITAGGIDTSGFDPGTMASKKVRGLFACGEVLDIDGDCGGFNLQWAWASGFLAGQSAVDYLEAACDEPRT